MAVYRNEETLARVRLQFVLVALVGLGVGAVGIVRFVSSDERPTVVMLASLALAAIGLGGLALVRRAERVAIETGREGIVVRNVASTRRIAWSDVAGFEEDERRRGVTQAVVRTTGGSTHPISACGDPGPACATILKGLRRELDAARRT